MFLKTDKVQPNVLNSVGEGTTLVASVHLLFWMGGWLDQLDKDQISPTKVKFELVLSLVTIRFLLSNEAISVSLAPTCQPSPTSSPV